MSQPSQTLSVEEEAGSLLLDISERWILDWKSRVHFAGYYAQTPVLVF